VGASENGDRLPVGLSRRQLLGYSAAASAVALTFGGGRAFAATSSSTIDANLYGLNASMPEGGAARGLSRAASTSAWGGYSNGQIPASAMTKVPVSVGQPYLRADAAAAYFDLDKAFRAKFGKSLAITEAYRDLARQQALYAAYQAGTGNKAAVPGTSVHGWALACDFGSGLTSYGTPEKNWMNANGPSFGWQPKGDGFPDQAEPWHFGTTAVTRGRGPERIEQPTTTCASSSPLAEASPSSGPATSTSSPRGSSSRRRRSSGATRSSVTTVSSTSGGRWSSRARPPDPHHTLL